MRPLSKVIDAIINIIPDDEPLKERFVADAKSIKASIPYTAPEDQGIRWEQFGDLLRFCFPVLDTDWKMKVQGVIIDNLDYRNYL